MNTATNPFLQLAVLLIGGGILRFVIDLFGARKANRLEGAERNNIIAEGASAAVTSLKAALETATATHDQLRSERDTAIAERNELAHEVQTLRIEVHLLQDQLHGYEHRPPRSRQRRTDPTP